MASEFEIRIKIGAGVDDASVTAAVADLDRKFDKAFDDIAARPITLPKIDVPAIDVPVVTLPPIDIPPIELPPFDFPVPKGVSQLAIDFDEATAAAKKLEAEQRSALAALIVAGDEGSDQYIELVAGIIDARKQSEELAQAQARVNKIFEDLEPPKPLPPADLPDSNAGKRAFEFNQLSEMVDRAAESLSAITQPAVQFGSSLAAVGAITGQSGEPLEKLGGVARQLALDFGGSATDQLASFQGILSKFGAEVADTPAALGKLAENVNILSKASGDDAATSMGAITDSMLQFGLVTGDATKDAETSTRIINALAASAQVGAAEIPQVAEAILQAGVAAKGANLDFESTNAALQVLAVGGKVGSEAGISLRNVLGLMQNASSTAEEAMKSLGTSSNELGQVLTTQGLGPAMEIIRSGMNNLGSDAERNKTLMQVFGTENAAAAGILLDNADKLEEFEKGIRAGQEGMGAAFEQAAQRMDTAQGQIDRAQAFIAEGFMTITDALGTQVTAMAATFADLAPTLQGAAGLKELIPDGIFDKAGSALKGVLLPALSQLGILKKINQAATIAETAAEAANTVVKGGQAAATATATTAQYALNTAMLANPIFLITAGIGLAIGAFLLFSNSTKDLAEATADANAALEEFRGADAAAKAAEKGADGISKLADEFDKLEGKGDPESQKRFNEVAAQLAEQVPEAVTAIDQFNAVGEKTGTTYEASTKLVRLMADDQRKLAQEVKASALANLDDQAQALTESYNEALVSQQELREDKKKLQEVNAAGLGDLGSAELFGNPFETMKDDLSDVNVELLEHKKKIDEARPQIESLVDGYQEMGLSAEEIAKRIGFTVDQVREFKGELAGSLVSSKALESAIGGMDESQQRLVRATALQAEGYAQAQGKVDELNRKLADAEFGGDKELASKLEKELDEAQKVADEKKVTLEAKLEETGVKEALDAIPEAARSKIIPLTTTLDVVVSDKSLAETQAKAGGVLREISELQKQQAAAIGTASEGAYDAKLLARQQDFKKNLETQAVAIATNSERLKELKAQKEAATDPKEVERLSGEIVSMEKKTDAAAKQFVNAANQGKRVGAIKGDVKDVGTEFGFTGKAADGAAVAVGGIDEQNKKSKLSASELAEEFKKVREAATSALEQVKQDAIGLLARIRSTADDAEKQRLQGLYDAKIEEARKLAQGSIDGDRIIKDVENAIGVTTLSALEQRQAEEARKRKELAEKRRRDNEALVRARLENDRDAEQLVVDSMADGLAKEIAQAELNIRFKERENRELKAIDEAAVARGELTRKLFAEAEKTRTLELRQLQAERRRVIADAAGDTGIDFFKTEAEALKTRAETLRADAERITATDAASIQRRTQLTLSALQLSTKAKVDEIINGSQEFIEQIEKQAKPEEDALLSATIRKLEADAGTDERAKAQAQAAFDAAQAAYQARVRVLREEFLQAQLAARTLLGQTITNAVEAGEDQTITINTKGATDAIAAVRREAIAAESDLRRQDLLLAQLAIDEKLALDLTANEKNKARQLQLVREANAEKLELERAYLRETNILWDVAYGDLSTIVSGFFSEMTAERRKELQTQIEDVDKQIAKLTESLLKQQKSISEYDDELFDLLEQRREASEELTNDALSFWEKLAVGADAAFSSIEKSMTTRLDGATQRLNESITFALDSASAAASDTFGSLNDKLDAFSDEFSEKSDAMLKTLLDVGNAAAGQLVAIWGQMGATGKATLGDFADAAIVTTLKTIRTIIEGNIVAIISAAFAISPVVGALSIPAILIVEVMLAKWEADAKSRLGQHGFKRGGFTGDGSPDDIADGPIHKREYVLPHQVIDVPENRKLAEHLHTGGSQREWFEERGAAWGFATIADLESLYIDIDGRLQSGFAGIDALRHQVELTQTLARGQQMTQFLAGSDLAVRNAIRHANAIGDEIVELRAMKDSQERIGAATIEKLASVDARLETLGSMIGRYMNITEDQKRLDREEYRLIKGAPKNRSENELALLREIRDSLKRLR